MAHPKILVTGATGKTGMAVALQLLRQGASVRAIVRRRDSRSEQLDRAGAETVVADLSKPDQIARAMQGCSGPIFSRRSPRRCSRAHPPSRRRRSMPGSSPSWASANGLPARTIPLG